MSSSNPKAKYTIGADMAAPFAVTLVINTGDVDLEQFRADLPRIVAKLEDYITGARADAERAAHAKG